MNKETLTQTLIDFLLGRTVDRLEPVKDKPGLYRIPKQEISVPFFGKKTIDLGDNFAFKPKEGNALIINKGNQLETFLLTHKGYCFLHELFPEEYLKKWDHEKNKWWIVQIPNTAQRVESIVGFLKKILNIPNTDPLPFLSDADITYLKENVGNEDFSDHIYDILEDSLLEEIYEKTGYLIFQGITFQKSPGFRKITFSQFDEKSSDKHTLPIRHREELSAYYRASFFPYAFVIPEAEDKNNIPTRIALTIKAQCVNPYIAHVMSGDPFTQFSSTVINAVTEVIRESFVHDISRKLILENKNSDDTQKEKASENIIRKIQEKVAHELIGQENSENTFFGFDFGMTSNVSEIVQIIDIDIVGPLAEKMKVQAAENYKLQNERDNELAKSQNDIEISKNKAAAKFLDKNSEAQAIKDAAKSIYGDDSVQSIEKYIENFIKPKQKQEQLEAFKPGGVAINNTDQILNTIINK